MTRPSSQPWLRSLALLVLALTAGCAGAQKPVPPLIYSMVLYPVADYPIHTANEGVEMAVIAWAPGRDIYADPKASLISIVPTALNVLDAGVLPIRVIISNQSRSIIVVEPSQALLVSGRVAYRPYSPQEAAEVVMLSSAFQGAIKGTSIRPMIQSILGGQLLFEAVTGAISGVVSGGLAGGTSGAAAGAGSALAPARNYERALAEMIRQAYSTHALTTTRLMPGFMAEGLIFFPSQAGLETLRLVLYDESKARPIIQPVSLTPPARQP